MVDSLNIENFRGISSLDIQGFSPINVLVGNNSCGKTTVLEALFLLFNANNPVAPLEMNGTRELTKVQFNHKYLFYSADSHRIIKIASESNNQSAILEIEAIQPTEFFLENNTESRTFNEIYKVPTGLKLTYNIINEQQQQYETRVEIENNINGARAKITPSTNKIPLPKSIYIPAFSSFDNISTFIKPLITNKQDAKILSIMQLVEPSIIGFRVLDDGIYIDVGVENLIPLNAGGDGLRRATFMLTAALACSNGMLLIDEFDSGLHYSVLKKVWQALLSVATDYNVQIFVTTHSEEALSALSNTLKSEQDFVTIHRIDRMEGKHRAVRYSQSTFVHVIKNDFEIR